MSCEVIRGTVLKPKGDGFELIKDGVLVVRDGVIERVDRVESFGGDGGMMVGGRNLSWEGGVLRYGKSELDHVGVIMPGCFDAHGHTFQPPAIAGKLVNDDGVTGWLPSTLKFETLVKESPQRAYDLAKYKFERHIENGIVGGIEYTTSSEEAARLVLQAAEDCGLKDTVKVGYVAMDQNVNNWAGVRLEESGEEILAATERLLKEFGNRVVVIDRFPIAVSSGLRRKLAALALRYGVLYETHMDESQKEWEIHNSIYRRRIVTVLRDDGVLDPGMKVGFAHGAHTNHHGFRMISEAVSDGCEVSLRACPNSNALLNSYGVSVNGVWRRDVSMPLVEWSQAGANLTLGLDNGGGRLVNIFQEAMWERGRRHTGGFMPSNEQVLRMATVNGLRSVGVKVDKLLREGERASFIVVEAAGGRVFGDDLPDDLETIAGRVIEGGQNSAGVKQVWVDGRRLK